MSYKKIEFSKIPYEFVTATLTKTQKESVELRYSIVNEKKEEGMTMKDFFCELAKKYNLSEHTIEWYYWTAKNRVKYYSSTS